MLSSAAPTKVSVPFADSGDKRTIPVPSQVGITPGAASFTTGFPPLTALPLSAGGIPPDYLDFNGVFNQITDLLRWFGAGGGFKYDATFSTAIGGYPKGSRLQSDDDLEVFISTVDGNTTNPNTGGAGWYSLLGPDGAKHVGYLYPDINAVKRELDEIFNDSLHVKTMGAVCDGVADDGPALQKAIDTGVRFIDACGMTMKVMTQVNLASNQTLLLTGGKLITGGTALKTLSAVTKTKWSLVGPFEINGDLVTNPGTGVTSCGIYIEDCSKWRVESPTVTNIKGYGIRLEPGASTAARGDHGVVTNPRIDSCVWNWHDTAGSGAEYCTITNMHTTGAAEAGIESAAGNITWLGGHCVDNLKDGFRLSNGANNTHGIVVGMNINHNAQYNLFATQILNGQTFVGCHFYSSNNVGGGAIFLDRCKGVYIDNGHWDCWLYNDKDGSSGLNIIRNMFCPGADGACKVLGGPNPGPDQLLVQNCYGSGSYTGGIPINDVSAVYVLAETITPQSLTSNVSTALQFATEVFDRRAAFNPATGVFTVPTGQGGLYNVAFHLTFTGTAMNVTASYVELKKNGTPRNLFSPRIFGTTKLDVSGSTTLMLAEGDTLALAAAITGTTPAFGDAGYYSDLSISRIA